MVLGQKRHGNSAHRPVMYRRTDHITVESGGVIDEIIHSVFDYAPSEFPAGAAMAAGGGRLRADGVEFRFDPFGIQSVRNFPECRISTAFFMRTAIYHQNFHNSSFTY